MKVLNPRTGQADYEIAPLSADQMAAEVTALRAAQPAWRARTVEERGELLCKLADAIDRHADAIAAALTTDTGRRMISHVEVTGTANLFRRWAANAPGVIAKAIGDPVQAAVPTIQIATQLHPYPLVGVISPWNFPLTLSLIDAVPALIAGCSVLIKPSEITPRFIRPFNTALAEVPEVDAVLTLVEGDGATGAALVPNVDYVCFTGSVATGRKVGIAAAEAMIPASLELGGKDPMLVLASANPEAAAKIALRASVVNTGQACQSLERIYVAADIAEPFLKALIAEAESVRINADDIGQGHIGPFIFAEQADIVQAQLDDAVAGGATIHTGGQVEDHGGKWLRPTVITGVTHDMKLMTEETFGPVIPVMTFASVEEGLALANDSIYGLSGAVVAGSLDEAEAVGRQLNVGGVSLNDGSLTSMVWEAEKSSFGKSGFGASRMGPTGLTRFFRRQALIRQSGAPAPIAAFAEDGAV